MGFVLLVLSVGVVVGTVAFTSGDEIGDEAVYLEPYDGENGEEYAELDENDELVVEVREVPPSSTTTIENLFNVSYGGDDTAEVWFEHDEPNVTLYNVATGRSLEREEDNVTLGSGETAVVGLEVDAGTTGALLDNITVHAKIVEEEDETTTSDGSDGGSVRGPWTESNVTGDNATISMRRLRPGEPVSAPVGPTPASNEAGVTIDRVAVSLERGGSTTMTINTRRIPTVGTARGTEPVFGYVVQTDLGATDIRSATVFLRIDRDRLREAKATPSDIRVFRRGREWEPVHSEVHTVTDDSVVVAVTTGRFSEFAVTFLVPEFEIDATVVGPAGDEGDAVGGEPGETVSVEAIVENVGLDDGTFPARLTVNGVQVANERVSLGPDERVVVGFEFELERSGRYDLAVSGTAVQPVVVEERASESDEHPTPGIDGDVTIYVDRNSGHALLGDGLTTVVDDRWTALGLVTILTLAVIVISTRILGGRRP